MKTRNNLAFFPTAILRTGARSELFLLSFFLLFGCGSEASKGGQEAVSVRLASAETRSLPPTLRTTGTLFGEEETTVSAKVPGRVSAILKDLGDEVSPGEPLLRLEEIDYVLARDARLELARESLAKLGLEKLPPEKFDVTALPTVERARLQAENVKSRFLRSEKLHQHDPPLLSDQEFSDLQTQYDVAKNDYRVAVLSARSEIAAARALFAQSELAEQALKDSVHTVPLGVRPDEPAAQAPVRYLVASRQVSVGDYVSVGTPLFRLVDPDPLKLKVAVPERYIGRIQLDQKVSVVTDAYTDLFEGSIARISPAVDVQSRTFGIEIRVPNSDRRLRAGMFARAEILTGEEEAVVIPQDAVRSFAGVDKVVTVADGKAIEVQVTLGDKSGDKVEILNGLLAGTRVVLKPSLGITNGTPLTETENDPAEKT